MSIETKYENELCFQEITMDRIKITAQPYSVILALFFSLEDVLSNKAKTHNTFRLQSTEDSLFPLFLRHLV